MNQKLRLRPRVLTASRQDRPQHPAAADRGARASPTARAHRIPTPELNRFLADVVAARQPPAKQGHRLKMLYMAQIGESPPRFAIQVNSRQRVTRDYAYFVENRLRERYGARRRARDHRLRRAQEPLEELNERPNRKHTEAR